MNVAMADQEINQILALFVLANERHSTADQVSKCRLADQFHSSAVLLTVARVDLPRVCQKCTRIGARSSQSSLP